MLIYCTLQMHVQQATYANELHVNVQHKTSTRHRKNSKQSGIVAIDSCFALFGARQYGVTTRESSDEKYPRTLI